MQDKHDIVLLSHGDGGLLTHRLLEKCFLPFFKNEILERLTDAACFLVQPGRMAFTTDSFVVDPIFFPGGDIGKLSVCGTVNDLAVSGAKPLYLAASFILEEGFALTELERIIGSMSLACKEAGVQIITGDTKVVGRGQADKIYITTTGIGYVLPEANLSYSRIKPGDAVLINGPLGEHGLAVMLQRESLGLQNQVSSDCAPLNKLIEPLLKRFPGIKFMRDLTRGGLATTAKEIALVSGIDIWFDETALPIGETVKGITELLGLDPLYLANEGKFLTVVEAREAEGALSFLKNDCGAEEACLIGEIKPGRGDVCLKTALGGVRKLNMLTGAPLPRIC